MPPPLNAAPPGLAHLPKAIDAREPPTIGSLFGGRSMRALRIGHVRVKDFDIAPLLQLRKLEYLDLPTITATDRERLLAALPNLRHGNVANPGQPQELT